MKGVAFKKGDGIMDYRVQLPSVKPLRKWDCREDITGSRYATC